MIPATTIERDPSTVCRIVAISLDTRDEMEKLVYALAARGMRVNAGILRRVVASWDANADTEIVVEDRVA